jgi:hypothetical protein
MKNGAALAALGQEIQTTVARALAEPELAGYGKALAAQLTRIASVTQTLHGAGDLNRTLANASLYLEAFGHVVVAWIWLEQALCAVGKAGHDTDFYRGKLQACAYFYKWELPKVGPQLDLLESLDTTALDMREEWF